MTLEDLKKIKHSLRELTPDVETFSWGPSYEFAIARKAEAIKIVNAAILKKLEKGLE